MQANVSYGTRKVSTLSSPHPTLPPQGGRASIRLPPPLWGKGRGGGWIPADEARTFRVRVSLPPPWPPSRSRALAIGAGTCRAGAEPTSFRFDFGPGKVAPGYLQVVPATVYTQGTRLRVRPGFDRLGGRPGRRRPAPRRLLHERQALLLLGRPARGELQRHGHPRRPGRRIGHHRQGRVAAADAGEGPDARAASSRPGRSRSTSGTAGSASGGPGQVEGPRAGRRSTGTTS